MISGIDVARFNFSHGSHEEHKQRIDITALLRKIRYPRICSSTRKVGNSVGQIQNGSIMMEAGNDFTLTARDVVGDETIASEL